MSYNARIRPSRTSMEMNMRSLCRMYALPMSFALILLAPSALAQHQRVLGFLPSSNAFHFDNNHWPNEAVYDITLPIHNLELGNAHGGLCGGMTYAIRDLFETGLLPPADVAPPAMGTPTYTYI